MKKANKGRGNPAWQQFVDDSVAHLLAGGTRKVDELVTKVQRMVQVDAIHRHDSPVRHFRPTPYKLQIMISRNTGPDGPIVPAYSVPPRYVDERYATALAHNRERTAGQDAELRSQLDDLASAARYQDELAQRAAARASRLHALVGQLRSRAGAL